MEPLTPPVFHILLALAGGERHGYAIMQEAERRSGGQVRLGPGTLYGAIKRLREQGLIEESDAPAEAEEGDERRRYYRLTAAGRAAAAGEAERLADLVAAARAARLIPSPETA